MGDHVGIPGAVLPFLVLLKVNHPTNQLFDAQLYRHAYQRIFWTGHGFGKSSSRTCISNLFCCLNPKIDEVMANWRKLPLSSSQIRYCACCSSSFSLLLECIWIKCNYWFIERWCMHAIHHSWVDQSCLSWSCCVLCVHNTGCKVGGIIFRKIFAKPVGIVAIQFPSQRILSGSIPQWCTA